MDPRPKTITTDLNQRNQIPMENQGKSHGSRSRRVVLFPLPFQGHINPMLQLASILYSKGFSITILHTNFNSPNTSSYPHFTFRAILDNDPKDEKFAKLSSEGISNSLSLILLFNQYGADCFHEEMKQILLASEKQEEPIACLITDSLWHFTQSVADSLKIPRIVLRTSSMFCLLVYASIPLLDDRGYFKLINSDFEGPVLDFLFVKVKDISKMGIKSHKEPMAEFTANMVKQTKASSGIIWNSFMELEDTMIEKILLEFPIPNFLIGAFHKYFPASSSSLLEQDRSIISWLGHQAPNSVLYASFGSVVQLDEKDFLEIAHGLAHSEQTFLWVVRPGLVKGSEWTERLPSGYLDLVGERGRIVKWAPQQEVLAHPATGAFWTHNGWNSTLESVSEGVPMICLIQSN